MKSDNLKGYSLHRNSIQRSTSIDNLNYGQIALNTSRKKEGLFIKGCRKIYKNIFLIITIILILYVYFIYLFVIIFIDNSSI